MDIIKLTEKTLPWFLPILPEDRARALREDPAVFALGAVREGTACGVLVCRASDLLAEITYLAVSDCFRRQGTATALIDFLCQYAWPSAIPVVCTFAAPGREDPLCRLFAGHPFFTLAQEDGFGCEIPLSALSGNGRLAAFRDRAGEPVPFFSLPAVERRQFSCAPPPREVPYFQALDVPSTPFDRDLCLCCRDREGVEAAVFLTKESDGLELSLAWSAPGRQGALLGLLARCAERIAARGDKGVLRIAAVTPESAAIVDQLFPERTVTERFYRAVWDMELKGGRENAG